MRFSLRGIFWATTMLAAVFGFFACSGELYHAYRYAGVQTVGSVVAEYPEIDRVWLATNDELYLEVEEV